MSLKEKLKKYLKEIILFSIILFIMANIISLYRSYDINIVQKRIENLDLLKDEVTILHFWATWCPTCKIEASNIEYISNHNNTLTIAVNSGMTKDIEAYLEKNDLTFKYINDSMGRIAREFNIGVYPTTLIFNKNKELVFSEVGYTSTWGLMARAYIASIY